MSVTRLVAARQEPSVTPSTGKQLAAESQVILTVTGASTTRVAATAEISIYAFFCLCMRRRQRQTIKDAEHQGGSRGRISTIVPPVPDPLATQIAALEKKNMTLQNKTQGEMEHRPDGFETNARMSIRSQDSDVLPKY
ncbi:hypothetical protein DL96DRAFT_1559152 [Flagelloscypha sp. PMI_526]|nr:hypothetical protein DL96DRAFT_1559152 [Flagelloscypha sp. PMI_526]